MKLYDLFEGQEIKRGLKFTLPPTYVMPELPNNDAYLQYRHLVALASARSRKEKSDHKMAHESPWGENQAVICYVPQDLETLDIANDIMGVTKKALTTTPSSEAPWRNTVSPVRKFVDISESDIGQHTHGTIVMLIPTKESANNIAKWCNLNKISCMDPKELHCTVLYSRKPVESLNSIDGKKTAVNARILGLKNLGTALALELESPVILNIHKWMIAKGGTHDFSQFIPHLSLNYDCTSDNVPDVKAHGLIVEFDSVCVRPIDPNYSKNNGKDK